MKKRVFTAILALILCFTQVLPALAAPSTNYTLTGNQADDVVAVGMAQEGKVRSDFGYTAAWCSYWTCWVGRTAGADFPSKDLPCPDDIAEWFINNDKGKFYCFRDGNYNYLINEGVTNTQNIIQTSREAFTPKKGDLVCFLWPKDETENGYNWSHIGIVTEDYTGNGSIKVIEGNADNGSTGVVAYTNYTYGSKVVGIIRPDYKNAAAAESAVRARIDLLYSKLGGKFFTTTGETCGNNNCDACDVTKIIKTDYLKNLVDNFVPDSSVGNLAHNYGKGNPYTNGWSCCGFANYAGWYIFAETTSSKVTFNCSCPNGKPVAFSKANLQATGIKPGDVLRFSDDPTSGKVNGHSAIFIDFTEDGILVLDSNYSEGGTYPKNLVRQHVIKYSIFDYVCVSRAANYNDLGSADDCTTYKTQYRYHMYVNENGKRYVCPYYGQEAYPGTTFVLTYTDWLDEPLPVNNGQYTCYVHTKSTKCEAYGCIDPTWEGDRYMDENGLSWIRQETRTVAVSSTANGLVQGSDGVLRYYVNGKEATDYTGLVAHTDGKTYYVYKGSVPTNYTGLCVHTTGVVYYVSNGVVSTEYAGLYRHSNGTSYYVYKGVVPTSYIGLCYHTDGKSYYVYQGVAVSHYTGLYNHTDGKVYYINQGVIDPAYIGLYTHTTGITYYVYKGVVMTNYTGLCLHTDGNAYYVYNGVVQANYIGFYLHSDGNLYYIVHGTIAVNYTGLALHSDGKLYYVKNGAFDSGYNGSATYNGMVYTVVNGIAQP